MRILIVEDELALAETLRRGLTEEHYVVDVVSDGRDAVDYAGAAPYDAIILDVMLPGVDGFTVCQRLRDAGITSHVLMLTALSTIDDRVHDLDSGADDYLTEADVPRLRALLVAALAIGLAIGLPLAALGGWWLAGRALAPVRAMTETANHIEAEHLTQRLPQPAQNDELGRLAHTLNQLLDRLEAAFQRERRFTADISHDLRTPLALMKSTVGVALNRPRTVTELQDTLTEVDSQIDRLSGLLDAALTLARADSGELMERFVPLDLSELLTDLSETSASYTEEQHGQDIACDIALGLWVKGDRDQLTRIFLNLLDNAMQHTPAGGAIRLTATAQGEQIMATVEDNGPGIAPEDLPHIFDRSYRSDRARTTGGQGHYGLGLSIARTIARAHGGDITAQSTLGKGGRFIVSLPRTDPPESSPL